LYHSCRIHDIEGETYVDLLEINYEKVSLTVAGCKYPKHAIRDFAVYVALALPHTNIFFFLSNISILFFHHIDKQFQGTFLVKTDRKLNKILDLN